MFRELLIPTLAAAMSLPAAGGAMAAGEGPYAGLRGGASMLTDSAVTAPAGDDYPALDVTSRSDTGFAVSGALGHALGKGWRVEGELGYRKNGVDEIDVKSPGGLVAIQFPTFAALPESVQDRIVAGARGRQAISGDVSMVTLMVNGYYDVELGAGWRPYLGGGLGVAFVSLDAESAGGVSLVDDRDTVFAYQAGAGVGRELVVPGGRPVIVSLDYRYFGTADATFTGDVTGAEFETELDGHYVGIGLRFGL